MRLPVTGMPLLGNDTSVPSYLYKFRHYEEVSKHLDILRREEIFFSSPARFNDPFDTHLPEVYDSGTTAQIKRMYEHVLQQENPKLTQREIRTIEKEAYKRGIHRDRRALVQALQDTIDRDLGVFSLSRDYRSLLSWAHYSKDHTGFCIGFRTQILVQLCMEELKLRDRTMLLGKIVYSSQYPRIDHFKDKEQDKAIAACSPSPKSGNMNMSIDFFCWITPILTSSCRIQRSDVSSLDAVSNQNTKKHSWISPSSRSKTSLS
jgi:hypothetical protein